jgi:uncharacterized membrane protein
MTKNEFLNELQSVLNGELPEEDIKNNIRFYDDYIRSETNNIGEESIIRQIGEPRLIAKTIIETYQMSHSPINYNKRNERAYKDVNDTDQNIFKDIDQDMFNNKSRYHQFKIPIELKWYQKLILIFIGIIIVLMFLIIGGLLVKIFFSVGIPFLIIYYIYRIIKNNV